ncbi:MAG: hypothetical protein ACM3PZ_03410 [Bacillota bacterium]
MKKCLIFVLLIPALLSCKRLDDFFSSTETVRLPPGKKLEDVSWKNGKLFYLIRDMRPSEKPETYTFSEEKNLLSLNESFIIIESR